MAFESILNPLFAPLLKLPVFWSIFLIALGISVLITLVYKWMTDQHLMKTLKEDMKKFQKELKELKEHPKKFMEVQKRAMETNMKYMMHSMKPTLITFIPIIIIFGWLNAHLAYEPINPGEEFIATAILEDDSEGIIKILTSPKGIEIVNNATQVIIDNKAEWVLKGNLGNYLLEFDFEDKVYKRDVLITEERSYEKPIMLVKDSKIKSLNINNEKVKPIPGLNLGWLWVYIIFSIIFSISLRKILKLH